MNIVRTLMLFLFGATLAGTTLFAQETAAPTASESAAAAPAAAGQPNEKEMMAQMMEMARVTENHQLLASMDGAWTYTVKLWMNGDSTSKPQESKGSATRKSIMGGRFVVMDVSGKMQMPGADGKMKNFEFKGRGTEGYDNAKKKFVSSWIDNTGTGMMMADGTYDPATKTFTYTSEYEQLPGQKTQVRETVRLSDKDHMTLEWFENHGGKEAKTMEIDYTRKK